MKKQMSRILSLVIALCLLVSINAAYAGEFDSETITVNGERYIVVIHENDSSRIVSMYDGENNLIEKYSFLKNENEIVNLLTDDVVGYGVLQNSNAREAIIDDEGYYYGGWYLYGIDNISTQTGFIAALLSVGTTIGVATEIATSAGIAGLFIGGQSVIDYYFDIKIDEWWKTDTLYQYCKRIVNVYKGRYVENGINDHVGGPSEWVRKTSINN